MSNTHRTDDPAGVTLGNGATVLEYTQQYEAAPGWRRNGIALCQRQDSHDPYVTWRLIQDEEGTWFAEGGTYHRNISEAVETYRERVNR